MNAKRILGGSIEFGSGAHAEIAVTRRLVQTQADNILREVAASDTPARTLLRIMRDCPDHEEFSDSPCSPSNKLELFCSDELSIMESIPIAMHAAGCPDCWKRVHDAEFLERVEMGKKAREAAFLARLSRTIQEERERPWESQRGLIKKQHAVYQEERASRRAITSGGTGWLFGWLLRLRVLMAPAQALLLPLAMAAGTGGAMASMVVHWAQPTVVVPDELIAADQATRRLLQSKVENEPAPSGALALATASARRGANSNRQATGKNINDAPWPRRVHRNLMPPAPHGLAPEADPQASEKTPQHLPGRNVGGVPRKKGQA